MQRQLYCEGIGSAIVTFSLLGWVLTLDVNLVLVLILVDVEYELYHAGEWKPVSIRISL
jgi:hypothetical protein